jgi:hypothetical protein
MRRLTSGSVAMIDGMAALFLVALVYAGAIAIGSEAEGMKAAALDKIALEDLRTEIRATMAVMNMTSQPLDATRFEIGILIFSIQPVTGEVSQDFFISNEGGVKVFHVVEKG